MNGNFLIWLATLELKFLHNSDVGLMHVGGCNFWVWVSYLFIWRAKGHEDLGLFYWCKKLLSEMTSWRNLEMYSQAMLLGTWDTDTFGLASFTYSISIVCTWHQSCWYSHRLVSLHRRSFLNICPVFGLVWVLWSGVWVEKQKLQIAWVVGELLHSQIVYSHLFI